MEAKTTPMIAVMPTAGMGHLIPLVEFAKRLVTRHRFAVNIFVPSDKPPSAAERAVLVSLPPAIQHEFLPPVSTDDIRASPDVRIETIISHIVVRSLPLIRSAIRSSRADVLVVDLFGTDAFDVAEEVGIPAYIFYPSTAACLWFFFHLPELDESVHGEFRDMTRPVSIPGCTPLSGADLLDPTQDRTNEAYKWLLHHTKRYRMARGVLVNSFPELEPGPVKALLESEPGMPRVYPVGPMVQADPDPVESPCLKWLDTQPHGSVLFVSFGSGGTLSYEQTNELAWGLEQRGCRFIWVVRKPDGSSNASYFIPPEDDDDDRFGFLPRGFLDLVRDRGLVLWSWAPQAAILRHVAVGGFLSHCGWNSTLESMVNGVPLIAWPLYAEQRMNAPFLVHDAKVAVRVNRGFVRRSEIAELVKSLMEGEEGKQVRRRMKELQEAAVRCLTDTGSSTRSLDDLVRTWNDPTHEK